MRGVKAITAAATAVLLLAEMGPVPALAETIESALVRSYQNNPQLNAQRAQVRSIDENVPQALSGYRPKVSLTATAGGQYTDEKLTAGTPAVSGVSRQRTVGITANQSLFNAQNAPKVRQAESQVSSAREGLRVLEQSVLLSAATIYMDYLRDAAIVEVQRSNTRVLEQTLKQTQDRFNVGEVTRTDVAQSEAQLAAGRSQQLTVESNLTTTRSNYRRIIGVEPQNVAPGSPVDRFLPPTLSAAVELSLTQNPNVTAAMYGVDVSFLQTKVAEGALLPSVALQATVSQGYETQLTVYRLFNASVGVQLSLPIYQGGTEYSLIRQSKESLAQQRLVLDQTRDQARANVVTAWGQLVAGKSQVSSAQAQVTASEIALNGVREEAKAGQRTTLDVLNAQQALVNARNALVTAQHDRVVASYNVLNAIGRLSPQVMGLATNVYDPSVHYQQVRDNWAGVRTPDGR
ncbi:TolC family outer membrane protein [Bradyrhizobium viridifuturi]|jgi:outer membrane protein|uniref:TolC family outer membrane protein n=1 Tax=Bradyrhizobium TaxID=374 RepID=UPI000396521C|nr:MULTISPECIES: TolC family outer membrane protein [Bradyrhizobium]ERF85837.1 MAG: TolC family type I secretion outer membrane protein [Bradyrhizobium sp. DFCI-1]OYU57813.1 MAG: channel protein TolC [Bradyrhizobium sp. PARBB1]PSO23451.1 channel protein TolC [Bradyrhizobium sp. MOS004]QRI73015.1 TolC family outer membrane protein [Bradyrhizobium sp. PSBB068]MBR1023936.1 TolC family outer membrane protein [Bradyrhizobium viridifuturi]